MKIRPNLVRNCVLMLNWPEPNNHSWDIESIQLLQPTAVILVVDCVWNTLGCAGGAGSYALHKWTTDSAPYTLIRRSIVADAKLGQHYFDRCPTLLFFYNASIGPIPALKTPFPPIFLPSFLPTEEAERQERLERTWTTFLQQKGHWGKLSRQEFEAYCRAPPDDILRERAQQMSSLADAALAEYSANKASSQQF
jgi:hypothetical protein